MQPGKRAVSSTVFIGGVPFDTLFHRDGRLVRAAGLFAFARRAAPGRMILHLELAEAINRCAVPTHPRWTWALTRGFDELLIRLASARMSVGEGPEATWHPEAEICLGDGPVDRDALRTEWSSTRLAGAGRR